MRSLLLFGWSTDHLSVKQLFLFPISKIQTNHIPTRHQVERAQVTKIITTPFFLKPKKIKKPLQTSNDFQFQFYKIRSLSLFPSFFFFSTRNYTQTTSTTKQNELSLSLTHTKTNCFFCVSWFSNHYVHHFQISPSHRAPIGRQDGAA